MCGEGRMCVCGVECMYGEDMCVAGCVHGGGCVCVGEDVCMRG